MYTIGQCGPLLGKYFTCGKCDRRMLTTMAGTNVFPSSEKPYYRKGMWISAAMCLMVAVTAIILSGWIIWENRKLDREGVQDEEFDTDIGEEQGHHVRHKGIW